MRWHPRALAPTDDAGAVTSSLAYATASADGTGKLWNMEGKCLHTLEGHTGRLARSAFHPSGAHDWAPVPLLTALPQDRYSLQHSNYGSGT